MGGSSNNKKKNLKDIKLTKGVHPYSRKAIQMKRAMGRQDKMSRIALSGRHMGTGLATSISESIKGLLAQKCLWFKYAMDPEKSKLDSSELQSLTASYISRHDQEMETLKQSALASQKSFRKRKVPDPPKLVLLTSLYQKESLEFERGVMEVPDLTNPKNVTFLRGWEGDLNCMNRIILTRVKSGVTSHAVNESQASVKNGMIMDAEVEPGPGPEDTAMAEN